MSDDPLYELGWTDISVGYHGDDGHMHFGGDMIDMEATFGPGDVVGCGILLLPLVPSRPRVFFTKNGTLLPHMLSLSELADCCAGSFIYPIIVSILYC